MAPMPVDDLVLGTSASYTATPFVSSSMAIEVEHNFETRDLHKELVDFRNDMNQMQAQIARFTVAVVVLNCLIMALIIWIFLWLKLRCNKYYIKPKPGYSGNTNTFSVGSCFCGLRGNRRFSVQETDHSQSCLSGCENAISYHQLERPSTSAMSQQFSATSIKLSEDNSASSATFPETSYRYSKMVETRTDQLSEIKSIPLSVNYSVAQSDGNSLKILDSAALLASSETKSFEPPETDRHPTMSSSGSYTPASQISVSAVMKGSVGEFISSLSRHCSRQQSRVEQEGPESSSLTFDTSTAAEITQPSLTLRSASPEVTMRQISSSERSATNDDIRTAGSVDESQSSDKAIELHGDASLDSMQHRFGVTNDFQTHLSLRAFSTPTGCGRFAQVSEANNFQPSSSLSLGEFGDSSNGDVQQRRILSHPSGEHEQEIWSISNERIGLLGDNSFFEPIRDDVGTFCSEPENYSLPSNLNVIATRPAVGAVLAHAISLRSEEAEPIIEGEGAQERNTIIRVLARSSSAGISGELRLMNDDSKDSKTLRLFNLPYVRQFWWGAEGPCVAIEGMTREVGERRVRQALRDHGIERFVFQMVEPLRSRYSPT